MCTSQQFPLSEPAVAVRDVLAELAHGYADTHSERGVRAMQIKPARAKRASKSERAEQ